MKLSSFEKFVIYQTFVLRNMGAVSEFARRRGANLNELCVLIAVRYYDSAEETIHEGCTQQEICKRMPTMPKQTVSTTVKRLEKNEYVQCEPFEDDARVKIIRLTPQGEQYADYLLGDYVSFGLQTVEQFSDEEFLQLLNLTRKFDTMLEAAFGLGHIGSDIDIPQQA